MLFFGLRWRSRLAVDRRAAFCGLAKAPDLLFVDTHVLLPEKKRFILAQKPSLSPAGFGWRP